MATGRSANMFPPSTISTESYFAVDLVCNGHIQHSTPYRLENQQGYNRTFSKFVRLRRSALPEILLQYKYSCPYIGVWTYPDSTKEQLVADVSVVLGDEVVERKRYIVPCLSQNGCGITRLILSQLWSGIGFLRPSVSKAEDEDGQRSSRSDEQVGCASKSGGNDRGRIILRLCLTKTPQTGSPGDIPLDEFHLQLMEDDEYAHLLETEMDREAAGEGLNTAEQEMSHLLEELDPVSRQQEIDARRLVDSLVDSPDEL